MSFSRVKSTGWTDNVDTITAAQLNQLDTNVSRAVDGTSGGAYAPATVIEIGGSGLKVSNATRLGYSSRSLSRVQRAPLVTTSGTLALSASGALAIAAAQSGQQALSVPNGASLVSVTFYHDRNDTGIAPGVKVTGAVHKVRITTGVATTLATATEDTTTPLASYEAHHGFTVTLASPETIANTENYYYVQFVGESGGNTAATSWFPSIATFTVTDQDEAP